MSQDSIEEIDTRFQAPGTEPCFQCGTSISVRVDVCPNCKERLPTKTRRAKAAQSAVLPAYPHPPIEAPAVRSSGINIGWFLLVGGLIVAGYFLFFYETVIQEESYWIDAPTKSNPYNSELIIPKPAHNLGLQQNRLLGSIVGIGIAVVGAIKIMVDGRRE